uniref:DUF148 domain-containing protein n=1 Tax=Syphacia muris TaxID=451379 RepID=A0A0N5ALU1_9BILA
MYTMQIYIEKTNDLNDDSDDDDDDDDDDGDQLNDVCLQERRRADGKRRRQDSIFSKMRTLFVLLVVVALAYCQLPPFLDGAPKDAVDQWNEMASHFGDLSENEIIEKVNAYVAKHPEIKDAFEKFKTQVIEDQKKAEAEHKATVAKLSKEAQEADKKLLAISSDKTIKQKEKDLKIQEIFSTLPKSVVEELDKANA